MPLDAYSPCPGGRDKKIRHCCPDLLKELQLLETMLQNGQAAAAVAKIDALEKDHPDCACLKATKCVALRTAGRWEEYFDLANAFAAAEPDNPQALAERTLALTAGGDAVEALFTLIDGIETTEAGKLHHALLLPAVITASRLVEEEKIFPAVALLKLVQAFQPQNQDAAVLLHRIYSRRDLPLLLKELPFDHKSPSEWAGTGRYNVAVSEMATGQWKKARAILEELIPSADAWPYLWRSLAVVRLWLCDEIGAVQALERFAQATSVDPDDAVDAETLLYFLRDESDTIEIVQTTHPVDNDAKALEAFLSAGDFVNVPFDPRRYGDAEHPAPNHIFKVMDRPFPADRETPTLENTPLLLGTLLLYGKQTDRDARIELHVTTEHKDRLTARIGQVAGSDFGPETESLSMARLPWLTNRLQPEFQFKPTAELNAEQVAALYRDYLEKVFVPEWLSRSSSDFGGKTPEELAKAGNAGAKLAGAIATLGVLADSRSAGELTAMLRKKLNLPEPTVLRSPDSDEEALRFFNALPAWRWSRVDLSNVSPAVLGQLLSVAQLLSVTEAAEKFADKILAQPAPETLDSAAANVRLLAYEAALESASLESPPTRAFELLDKATAEAKKYGVSDSRLNLREVMLRLAAGDVVGFQRTVEHLAREHRNEPETMDALQSMLINLGVLNPDGSPRQMPVPGQSADPLTQGGPGERLGGDLGTGPSQPSSGLWTPGSDEPASGGGKLWTPE